MHGVHEYTYLRERITITSTLMRISYELSRAIGVTIGALYWVGTIACLFVIMLQYPLVLQGTAKCP